MRYFLLLPAILLTLRCSVADDDRKIGHQTWRKKPDCRPFPQSFFDTVPFLLDFFRWSCSFLRELLNVTYFILNTVLLSVCEVISNLFGFLRHFIKLLEYLGYGIRVVFQINYNFVSALLTCISTFCKYVFFSVRYIVETIVNSMVSVFKGTINILQRLIWSIPLGFNYAFESVWTAKNATSVVLYQSYLGWKYILTAPGSALMNITTSVAAVLECLIVSTWNTAVLLGELAWSAVLLAFRGFGIASDTVFAYFLSAGHHFLSFLSQLLYGVQELTRMFGHSLLWLLNSFKWLLAFIFNRMINGFCFIFAAISWSVSGIIYFVCDACGFVFAGFGSLLRSSLQSFRILASAAANISPAGIFTLATLLSSAVMILYSWFVLRVNLLAYTFELLEKSLQGVLALLATFQWPSFSRNERLYSDTDHVNQSYSSCPPRDEKEDDLRRQLERERDKTLCVVCQSETKNILVIPCRHMCMCKNCANVLYHGQRNQRGTCPLCRTPISSVLEIYS